MVQSHPPEVDVGELRLSWGDRVYLSRLRCGHHTALQSHQHRMGNALSDLCQRCLAAPDTQSSTSCPAISPGRLNHRITSERDLWEHPWNSINFLSGCGPNIGACTSHYIPNMHMSVGTMVSGRFACCGSSSAGGARANRQQQHPEATSNLTKPSLLACASWHSLLSDNTMLFSGQVRLLNI